MPPVHIVPLVLLLTLPSQLCVRSMRLKGPESVRGTAPDAAVLLQQGQSEATNSMALNDMVLNDMALTCSSLGKAYLASLPIPFPPSRVSLVPAVGLLMCCPTEVWDKLKGIFASTRQKARDWQMPNVQRLVESVPFKLTPADVMEEAKIMRRESVMELYTALVEDLDSEHSTQNSSWSGSQLLDWATYQLGLWPDSEERYATKNYTSNADAKTDIEEKYPWVLYPRLIAASEDERISQDEKSALLEAMEQLKSDNDWLPAMPGQYQPQTKVVAELIEIHSTGLSRYLAVGRIEDLYAYSPTEAAMVEEQLTAKFRKYGEPGSLRIDMYTGVIEDQRQPMCEQQGRLASQAIMKVNAPRTNGYLDKPSDIQLHDLVARVYLFRKMRPEIVTLPGSHYQR